MSIVNADKGASGFDPEREDNAEILACLWDYLPRQKVGKGQPARRRTGWGTKTQQGLCATVRRLGRAGQ